MIKRIFIDCSFINFGRQPTGIPRVVLQYIECGYRWGAANGVQVIPVVTTPEGLVLVRPVPGLDAPAELNDLAEGVSQTELTGAHLARAAFYLQSALESANLRPCAANCEREVRETFNRYLTQASIPPFDVESGDVLFCPAYWHDIPPRYFKALQRLGCKIVTLVHDVLPVTFSKFYQAPWKHEFESNLLAAIRQSDALFAVSQYTADSIVELAERNGVANTVVGIAHNAYHPLVSEQTMEKITNGAFTSVLRKSSRYALFEESKPFIMVGSVEPKKGHIPTVRAFNALWQAGFQRPLVIIGRKGWLEESVVDAIHTSPYFHSKLFWFEDFDDLDLAFAYANSRGLVFASYAEGFGIPMVEALSAGCPVVAYQTPVNQEVLGEFGLMFDDFPSLAAHLLRLDDSAGFESARKHVASFRWPGWDESVGQLFTSLVSKFSKTA